MDDHDSITSSLKKFESNLANFSATVCKKCSRLSLQKHTPRDNESFSCRMCTVNKKNDSHHVTIPDPMPLELNKNMLTFVEEQLIALVFVHQYVYLRGFGEVASKGHCINFSQNISNIAEKLPRLPSELPLVIIKKKLHSGGTSDLKVRRSVVLLWLEYLKKNSIVPGYQKITICYDRIQNLPVEGELEGIKELETEKELNTQNLHASNQNEIINELMCTDIPHDKEAHDSLVEDFSSHSGVVIPPANLTSESSEINMFTEGLDTERMDIDYPPCDNDPLSEFNKPYLASMAFPTLFPTGK